MFSNLQHCPLQPDCPTDGLSGQFPAVGLPKYHKAWSALLLENLHVKLYLEPKSIYKFLNFKQDSASTHIVYDLLIHVFLNDTKHMHYI